MKVWEDRTWSVRVSHPARQKVHVWIDHQAIKHRYMSRSISAQRLEVIMIPEDLAREKKLL